MSVKEDESKLIKDPHTSDLVDPIFFNQRPVSMIETQNA